MSLASWSSYILGAILGYGIGCLTYGGIGFWLFGMTGLYFGIALATGFAIYGLGLINPRKMPELFNDL